MDPIVTIVMTIREKYSTTLVSIQSILDHTPPEIYTFILVDCGLPKDIKIPDRVKVIESDTMIPQKNRYKSLKEIMTKYTVFIDNDIIVEHNWLTHLIQCAEETECGIVGPVYLWNKDKIHMFGGTITIKNKNFNERQDLINSHRNILRNLKRKKCDYVEYHCLLIRSELNYIIDPNYTCIHEHIDLSLKAKELGFQTYIEPLSIVTYLNDVKLGECDLPFYKKRWDIQDSENDITYFCNKWGFLNNDTFGGVRNFIKNKIIK